MVLTIIRKYSYQGFAPLAITTQQRRIPSCANVPWLLGIALPREECMYHREQVEDCYPTLQL